MTLQVAWFFLIGVLLIGYAILDGFDLGVGFWQLFTRGERDRRVLLNSIGPVWDGNEVWLLTGAGAIFAAFPPVYASVFSGFYLAMMLLLLALICRAVSLEFRSKVENPRWRSTWDLVFGLSSTVAALLFGVALGNILRGVPLHPNGDYAGTFWGLLNPYALVIGLTGLAMLATHGALYIVLKAEQEQANRARRWAQRAWWFYLALAGVGTAWTVLGQPQLLRNYLHHPLLFALPLAALGAIGACRWWSGQGRDGRAFVASSLGIAGLMATAGVGLFPNLVPALGSPERSLTAFNASSSQNALGAMLVVALIGMPLVLGYTAFIYRTFRGKVVLDENSY